MSTENTQKNDYYQAYDAISFAIDTVARAAREISVAANLLASNPAYANALDPIDDYAIALQSTASAAASAIGSLIVARASDPG